MNRAFDKNTDELMSELSHSDTDLGAFLKRNEKNNIEINLENFWKELLGRTKMKNAEIINKSQISYYYFYEIIHGRKIPNTDKIVRIILAAKLNLEDCQKALTFCKKAKLYPKIKRDSILIYSINRQLSIDETNKELEKAGEEPLQ